MFLSKPIAKGIIIAAVAVLLIPIESKAVALGIIDESTDYNHLTDADLVLIAVPVNHIGEVLIEVLNKVGEHTLVMDAGSVKGHICEVVATHPHRQNIVAAHPMAATEHSGPEAPLYNLFDRKVMAQ